jgi:hypothetical protein
VRNDPFWTIEPQPPQWALDAGLPAPDPGEGIGDYCVRLGLPFNELVSGLSCRADVNIHIRFTNMIADRCPDVWRQHVQAWIADVRG